MISSRLLDAVLYFGTRVFLQLFRIGESALAILVFGFEIAHIWAADETYIRFRALGALRTLDPRLMANTTSWVFVPARGSRD